MNIKMIEAQDSEQQTRQRITLLATSMSYVLIFLDTSIVNVALDRIATGLGSGFIGLQWVVTAYVVVFASLVLSGGALSDTFGAHRIYTAGLVLFATASLISGCAPTLEALIGGRILQGVGSALLVPSALSMIRHAYPDEAVRARAIASWASAGGVAQILGPLAGGLLLTVFDWRSIFFVNVPVCIAGLWLAGKLGHEADDCGSRRFDLPGQVTSALAMVLLITTLIEQRELGWNNHWILVGIALVVVMTLFFVIIEYRSEAPMLPLFLFSNSAFSWISFSVLLGSSAFFGILFVLNLYFLRGAGYTPLQTGVVLLPLALFATVGNRVSAKRAARTKPMSLMIAGAGFRLIGFVGIAWASSRPFPALMAASLLLIGFGSGLSNPMTISTLLSTTDKKYAGIVSGSATAIGQLGASIGVAVFGAFLAAAPNIADGTRSSALVCAALTGLIILIFQILRRQQSSISVES